MPGRVFGRDWRLFLTIAGVILVFWLLWMLRSVLFSFILGLVIAYALMPLVWWIEKRLPRPGRYLQAKRISLIVLIYLTFFGLSGLFAYYIITAVVQSFSTLLQNAPDLFSSALLRIQEWFDSFRRQLPLAMQQPVNEFVANAGGAIGNAIRESLLRGATLIPSTIGTILGFVALPIFLFFVIKDWEKLGRGLYEAIPNWGNDHARSIITIIEKTIGQWVRAQLLLASVVGTLVFLGLLIMRVEFAPVLGIFAAVGEVIPTVGPWLSGAVAVLLTLATAPDKAIWVALLFGLVQLLENNLLAPRIQGAYMRIHPAIALVLIVVGTYLAGFWGLLLAIPLTSIAVKIYKYVLRHLEEDRHFFH
ncbi:MAG: AI-2E family transporter [Chloroflexi bacterium]|nr:AI-2E family transporter [Chloroflexota bacterium]